MKILKRLFYFCIIMIITLSLVLPMATLTGCGSTPNTLSELLKRNSGLSVSGEYLLGVNEKTTAANLASLFSSDKVTVVTDYTYSGTGSKVRLINGSNIIDELTVVVTGDTNGDGIIAASDYLRIKRAVLGTYTLENANLLAAFVSRSGNPTAKDYLFLKRHFLGTYNIYTGGTRDYNGTKIAYIPIDDRPVNVDRVIYLAESAGYKLLMPSPDYYSTKLDGNGTNSNGTKYGNRGALINWLKEVDAECDYFVISLDQVLSGGLVNSRVQNNSDLTYEYEIIDYLIELNNNNTVYFFDTVMRLASTVNYNGYGYDEYTKLRNYGAVARAAISGSNLTIDNIAAGYKFNASGNAIALPLPENEIDAYLAARTRKLRLIDYFLTAGGSDLNYCYIGVDDSSPNTTIQSNEITYIRGKLNNNGILFAGCDELGMMGIARLTAELYRQELPVAVTYFGGNENVLADSYDIASLKSNLEDHLTSLNAVITTPANASLEVLVLTKPKSLTLTQYSNQLLDRLEANIANNIPTVLIDACTTPGTLQSLMVSRALPLSTLIGYSNWNTVGNSIGIAVSQGVTRYIYIENSITVINSSSIAFMKSMTFAYIKDISYKIGANNASVLLGLINTSEAITAIKNFKTESFGTLSVSNYRYPWNRSFEMTFDIRVQ